MRHRLNILAKLFVCVFDEENEHVKIKFIAIFWVTMLMASTEMHIQNARQTQHMKRIEEAK